jgi:hypothetical protein
VKCVVPSPNLSPKRGEEHESPPLGGEDGRGGK